MKMQIWKVFLSEGVIGAIHGQSFPVYEGFVPDLKLTINHVTSFVNDEDEDGKIFRYQEGGENQLVKSPDPELICEIELSRTQIEDMKMLAMEDNPEKRVRKLVASVLKEHKIDASDYENDDDDWDEKTEQFLEKEDQ